MPLSYVASGHTALTDEGPISGSQFLWLLFGDESGDASGGFRHEVVVRSPLRLMTAVCHYLPDDE